MFYVTENHKALHMVIKKANPVCLVILVEKQMLAAKERQKSFYGNNERLVQRILAC